MPTIVVRYVTSTAVKSCADFLENIAKSEPETPAIIIQIIPCNVFSPLEAELNTINMAAKKF